MATYEPIIVSPATKRLLEHKLKEINKAREENYKLPLNLMKITHLAIEELTLKQGLK
jgi:phosphopantetheine adenylyltransferase